MIRQDCLAVSRKRRFEVVFDQICLPVAGQACSWDLRYNALRHLEGRGFHIRHATERSCWTRLSQPLCQCVSEEAPFQRVVAFESLQEFAVDKPIYPVGVGDKQEQ